MFGNLLFGLLGLLGVVCGIVHFTLEPAIDLGRAVDGVMGALTLLNLVVFGVNFYELCTATEED